MTSRKAWIVSLGALLIARVASAQEVTIGYQGLPHKSSGEAATGVKVSDDVLMHVGAGAEAGYDTNVFYQASGENGGPIASPIVRVGGFAELTNATRTGAVPSSIFFDLRGSLMYRYYGSNDCHITGSCTGGKSYQNALMPGAGLSIGLNPGQSVSFGLANTYQRFEDPPYAPGGTFITRDNNQFSTEVHWSPGGGRITATLRYTNMLDIFEQQFSFSNSDLNEIMLDAAWKWLPKTAIFLQLRQGYIFYLNEQPNTVGAKVPSYPLRVLAGLRGLITEKTSAIFTVGYANAFYSSGATTGGFLGSTYLELQVTYRPTLLSRIVGGYIHDFQNSVISAFYYDDQFYASFVQQLGPRFALDLSGRYHHKNYQGYFDVQGATTPTPRTDNTFQVGLTVDYFVRNWAYAGVGYALMANASAYTLPDPLNPGGPGTPVDYLKQQIFARIGVTY
jgi:hypothetical protein